MMQYPAYAAYVRLSRATHEHMWASALASINKHADMYLSAMEATDKMGPGHLELNPGIFIPEYAKYEIHEQPGGYVGNVFAGLLYHYSMVTAFYHGLAEGPVLQDQRNHMMVAGWATPPDGKLKRILEVGCSHGSTTISLRERFDNPDVEVWALDIGGPQVRYAHHRSVALGHKINFVQRLAEDTKFPDNYFDMIAINLLFHEVPSFAAKKIIAELNRITRPGGVWVGDAATQGGPRPGTISSLARTWAGHRFNFEVWTLQNNANDFPAIRKEAGWRTDTSTGKPITVKA
jgi:SAM-dependent methyltransferase